MTSIVLSRHVARISTLPRLRPSIVLGVGILLITTGYGARILTDGAGAMDLSNYLSTFLWLEGRDVSGTGQYRPPGLALYLWPWVKAFGLVGGGEIAGLAAAALWPVAFHGLLRRFFSPWPAVLTTLAAATTYGLVHPLVWGWLVLAGMSLALTGWWALMGLLETRHAQYGVAMVVAVNLLAMLDSVGFTLFALVSICTVLLSAPGWRRWPSLILWGTVTLLAASPWLWWGTLRFRDGSTAIGASYQVQPLGLLALLAPVAGWWVLRRRPRGLLAWVVVLLTVGTMGIWLLPPSIASGTLLYRASTYSMLTMILVAAQLVVFAYTRWRSWRWLTVGLAAGFLAVNWWSADAQLARSLAVPPVYASEHAAAIAWLRDHTEQGEPVIVSPMAFGWWLESTGERRAFQTDFHDLGGVFAYEGGLAWRLLAGDLVVTDGQWMHGVWEGGDSWWVRFDGSWLPVTGPGYQTDRVMSWPGFHDVPPVALSTDAVTYDTVEDARAAGVRYVAVDLTPRVVQHGPPPPWAATRFAGWEQVFNAGNVRVYRIP